MAEANDATIVPEETMPPETYTTRGKIYTNNPNQVNTYRCINRVLVRPKNSVQIIFKGEIPEVGETIEKKQKSTKTLSNSSRKK